MADTPAPAQPTQNSEQVISQAATQNIVTAINNLGASQANNETIISSTTSGDHIIIAKQGGKSISVFSLFLTVGSTASLTFINGTTNLTGALSMTAYSQLYLPDRKLPWFTCSPNSDFIINTSAAVTLGGRCYYAQE